jgi:dephospho-CoA kinase
MGKVFVIGLAGGIGSGKSTVAGMLGRLGARVLDADAMVHELLREPGIIRKVVRRFGKDVLARGGAIDRMKLGRAAFASKKNIRDLEKILHPPVVRRMKEEIGRLRRRKGSHVVVIDAPLLFEAALDRICDDVALVEAPKSERLRRLVSSRGWTRSELEKREKRQKTLDFKREKADTVVRNCDDRSETRERVRTYWRRIRKLLSDETQGRSRPGVSR